ncbi:hypothetical protein GEV33_005869 [Tenebrio molitor]|uniref:Uncharacterized protein n=1 Tax=Tenebrio molitor TaxID=7067 RepID=A0A8J6LL59_TENMO|nr:hypothetical protein GEV33_005869 [Tenebrio molitor]
MLLTRREMFEVWRQGKTLQQKNLSVLKFVSSKLSVEEFTDDEEYNPIKKKTRWAREPPPIAQCWQLRFVTRRQFRICQRRSNNIKKWQIRDEDEKKQVKEKKQRLIETLIVEQDILPDSMQELIRRKLTSKGKYTQDLRSFALTPHFYSPNAYRYVRKHWEQLLPHPGTLRKWYKVVDACPGFTKEALDCISLRTADSKPVLANLVFDEMVIREQLIWSEGRFIGGVNLGIQEDERIIINLRNPFTLFEDLNKKGLEFLLTYKLSQDFLETFFGAIRSRGGFNNNPNCLQFKTAYRQLLLRYEIKELDNGNCSFDGVQILHTSSKSVDNSSEVNTDVEINPEEIDEDIILSTFYELTHYVEGVVDYIAGFVAKKLKTKFEFVFKIWRGVMRRCHF